ncbi:hypothetical protein FocTR4_00003361 [Fusarium oxysporum f. sp. cubense]|uniref:Uncharacterized protein n=1 Tax=Fusarium oxysporum f. sp. cubense TaxID=61366 RepID=A0A5C6TB11_FUSOC|nr:hypothetical protein FocTR4_00003361 [Fusarium oxysporum f. sp. cubense]
MRQTDKTGQYKELMLANATDSDRNEVDEVGKVDTRTRASTNNAQPVLEGYDPIKD